MDEKSSLKYHANENWHWKIEQTRLLLDAGLDSALLKKAVLLYCMTIDQLIRSFPHTSTKPLLTQDFARDPFRIFLYMKTLNFWRQCVLFGKKLDSESKHMPILLITECNLHWNIYCSMSSYNSRCAVIPCDFRFLGSLKVHKNGNFFGSDFEICAFL